MSKRCPPGCNHSSHRPPSRKGSRPNKDDDPFSDPDWVAYADRAVRELVPMMANSGFVISLVPEGPTDIKFAVELGLSIMMDKPIIAVIQSGTKVPGKLLDVADEIVECDPEGMASKETRARLIAAMGRITGEKMTLEDDDALSDSGQGEADRDDEGQPGDAPSDLPGSADEVPREGDREPGPPPV